EADSAISDAMKALDEVDGGYSSVGKPGESGTGPSGSHDPVKQPSKSGPDVGSNGYGGYSGTSTGDGGGGGGGGGGGFGPSGPPADQRSATRKRRQWGRGGEQVPPGAGRPGPRGQRRRDWADRREGVRREPARDQQGGLQPGPRAPGEGVAALHGPHVQRLKP